MSLVRKPAVAGMFYPAEKKELNKMLSEFLKMSRTDEKAINGIIVPHAGYIYSGKTAAFAYNAFLNFLKENQVRNLVILGPAHRIYIRDIYQDANEKWETPLGKIELKKIEGIKSSSKAHAGEHSIEVQLPFVQKILEETKNKIEITPIIVGEITGEQTKNYAEILLKLPNSFFIISSDLSHFMTKSEAEKTDKETIKSIMLKNYESLDACGKYPLMIAVEMAKIKNWNFKLLKYSTSADESGDENSVVGYASLIF